MSQAKNLPARPNLEYLKKMAKDRLALLRAEGPSIKLAEAQLSIAREYGFASWRKLRTHVEHLRAAPREAQEITEFAQAIRKGDIAALRRKLRDDPGLANVDTGSGATSLHLAAEWNRPLIVKMLIAVGANSSAKFGRYGHTPLLWAVTTGSFDAVEALVQAGVKPDLFCATGMGDLATVGRFFTDSGALVDNASQTGSSRYDAAGNLMPCPPTTNVGIVSDALYCAARNGRANIVRELLTRGSALQFRGYLGGTPLQWAYFSGSIETVDLLLSAGADPTSRDDVFNCTPRAFGICVPASWGNLPLVRQQLVQDASLANIMEGRGTPLHEAARKGHAGIGKLLIASGADLSIRDSDGKTALDIATECGQEQFAQMLGVPSTTSQVKRSLLDTFLDASVPRPDSDHKSGSLKPARLLLVEHPELKQASIFAACVTGDASTIEQMLRADPSLAKSIGGVRDWPALCYLTFSRFLRDEKKRAKDFVKCAKLLLDAGADPNSSWPAAGDPSFREAALYGAAGIANCAPLTQLLLDAGADPNDHESLYHASEFADNAALRVLLEAKPKDVSYTLCHKMDMEDPAGVKLFIKHGANVNVLLTRGMFKGSRPLHFAIYRRRSLKVFRLLLNAGADPNLEDRKGVTPYQLARMLGLNEVAGLLKSKGADDNLDPRTAYLAALSSGDRKAVKTMLQNDPGLRDELKEADFKLLVDAGESGNAKAVRLMLDVGFPIATRGATYGGWDATALDQAAWNGHAAVVRLLLKRGADPNVKHGFGGDALGAAIHGANHAGHSRGVAAVKALAAVASDERLRKAIEYAKTEPNQEVTLQLEHALSERSAERKQTQ